MSSTKLFVLAALAVVSLTASVSGENFKIKIGGDTLEYEYVPYSKPVKQETTKASTVLVGDVRKAMESYLGAVANPKFSKTPLTWVRENESFKESIAESKKSFNLHHIRKYADVTSQLEKAKAFFLNSLKKVASGELNVDNSQFSLEDVRHYAKLIEEVVAGKSKPSEQAMIDLATFKINNQPLEDVITFYGALLVKGGLGKAVDGLIGGAEAF